MVYSRMVLLDFASNIGFNNCAALRLNLPQTEEGEGWGIRFSEGLDCLVLRL
jgi:hypothetical protein